MRLRIDTDELNAGLAGFGQNALLRVASEGEACASRMEEYAKANRPWHDRTGNARRTLRGVCGFSDAAGNASGNVFTVGVEGNMPYSVYLELGFDGRFSVLVPTVHWAASDFLRGVADGLCRGK